MLRWRDDAYTGSHPTGDDVLLLVEDAQISVRYDRDVKLPRYARAGILEVWLVDVANAVVEQYTSPRGGQYDRKQTFRRADTHSAHALPLALPVDEILG